VLRIVEKQPRRKVLGQVAVVFQILLVAGGPGHDGRMVAHIAYVRVIKLGGAQGKLAIVRIPCFQEVLPDEHAVFIGQIVKLAVGEMAVDTDGVHVHAEHELEIPFIGRPVHFRQEEVVVVVCTAHEEALAVQVEVPADALDLAYAHGEGLAVHRSACRIEQPYIQSVKVGLAVIPGPPQLGIREIEHQLRMVRGGRRANAVALVRGEVARPQRQLPLGAVTGRFGFEVHFHGRPFVHQARVHRHVADASGRSRHQAHTTRDAQCGDVVRLLVHIAVGALDVIGAVAPVVSDRRPDAHQQLVFRVELHLPGHVVIVGIDVAFVAAERVPVQECVGIIVGGVEFEAQLLS